jgi:LuxR family glucitol operon transcriptional activator
LANYQRLALFVLFDAIELDLITTIRTAANGASFLTSEEEAKAKAVLSRQTANALDPASPYDQLLGLDIGTKFQVLMRVRDNLDVAASSYFKELATSFEQIIPVRNAVMHGRPLNIEEYAAGFRFAQELLSKSARWPNLQKNYIDYTKSPEMFASRAVSLLDAPPDFGVLNNLPLPDYDDTGFFPRKELERLLKNRILGRYPVVTVLGDGGNGKTALTLQTLYSLIESNDHQFDLIIWFSAKTSALSVEGVRAIADSVTSSSTIISGAAEYEPGDDPPIIRLRRLLEQNRVLLVIDNLETVTGGLIQELVEDVPGESKILLTSRVPIGGDLPINVPELSEEEGRRFLRTVAEAHSVAVLKGLSNERLDFFVSRLSFKPLLIKWFVLGVKSGLDPNAIIANPKVALRFCLENVIDKLSPAAQAVSVVLATVRASISAAVIKEISLLTSLHVEEGLVELVRFGLVDAEDPNGVDRVFKLRQFVSSYIARIVEPSAEATAAIQERYRKADNEFSRERAREQHNRYDPRYFVTRSLSESVAARKLRQINRSIFEGDVDGIEEQLQELKTTNPAYFEVYRVEAFAFYKWSDYSRAITAYEAALEFAQSEPQLHFFFAGMLLRNGYCDRAEVEFSKALELDPGNPKVLREAARNAFQLHKYTDAEKYLAEAVATTSKTQRDIIITMDLQIQSYVRHIEHLVAMNNFTEAMERCEVFLNFLRGLDCRFFDATMLEHMRQVFSPIAAIRRDALNANIPLLDTLSDWVRTNAVASNETQRHNQFGSAGSRVGFLKQNGRKPSFGFLVDSDKNETFLAAANVDDEVWKWLNLDGAVSYDVTDGPKGNVAINVAIYK